MKKVLTCILVGSLLFGFTISGAANVLCFSGNGQFELESIYDDCCEADIVNDLTVADIQADEAHDCTDCTDFELDQPFWTKRFLKSFSGEQQQSLLAQLVYSHLQVVQTSTEYSYYPYLNIIPPISQFAVILDVTVIRC